MQDEIIESSEINLAAIKQEILDTLIEKIDKKYYLENPLEYVANKEVILKINKFLRKPDRRQNTINERSYRLFKDENKLRENENVLHNLGLTYSDIKTYETYAPYFAYVNPNYRKLKKEIIVVENKDAFWALKHIVQKQANIYMIIYGDGMRILKSFPQIRNFKVSEEDNFLYFGDIDYEGINMYYAFKDKYSDYNITLYKRGYEKMLDNEDDPPEMKTTQSRNMRNVQKFINEFDTKYAKRLKYILSNKMYIPQEAFML